MRTRSVNLLFPLKGVHRGFALAQQPPYTAWDARNVRGRAQLGGRRVRGGVRPGIQNYGPRSSGMTSDVLLVDSFEYRETQGYQFLEETFTGQTLGSPWRATSGGWTNNGLPTITNGEAVAAQGEDRVAIYDPSSLNRSGSGSGSTMFPHSVSIFIRPPVNGVAKYSVFYAVQSEAFDPIGATNYGAEARIELAADGSFTAVQYWNNGSGATSTSIASGSVSNFTAKANEGGWFTLRMLATQTELVSYYQGQELIRQTSVTINSAYKMFGFQIDCSAAASGTAGGRVALFRAIYERVDDQWKPGWRSVPVAIANQTVWYGDLTDTMQPMQWYNTSGYAALPLSHQKVGDASITGYGGRAIVGDEFYQKYYIADSGPVYVDESIRLKFLAGAAVDGHGSGDYGGIQRLQKVDASGAGLAWSPAELSLINAADQLCIEVLTDEDATPTADRVGVYMIRPGKGAENSTADGYLEIVVGIEGGSLNEVTPNTAGANWCRGMRVARGAKVLDLRTRQCKTITDIEVDRDTTSSFGEHWTCSENMPAAPASGARKHPGHPPLGCKLVAAWRDRLVWAAPQYEEHNWFMSANGTPRDYDYADALEGEQGAAVAGRPGEVNAISDNITALIPINNDYLVLGCRNSIYVMRGDPAFGGGMDNLSREIGVVDRNAWCRGPNGEVYVLSEHGLYAINPGGGAPQPMSHELLPDELRNINTEIANVTLECDVEDMGIWIFVTYDTGFSSRHWYFETDTGAFWPVRFVNAGHEPWCANRLRPRRPSVFSEAPVVLGCKDGAIRQFHPWYIYDQNRSIEAFVEYGPMRMWNGDHDGILAELSAVVAADSVNVSWSARGGNSPEAAANAAALAIHSGTWTAGRNYRNHPRVRGNALVLRVSSTDAPWAIEEIRAVIHEGGKARVL